MLKRKLTFQLIIAIIYCCNGWANLIKPGPSVIATKGAVWPKPQQQVSHNDYFILKVDTFKFEFPVGLCSIIDDATERYSKIIAHMLRPVPAKLPTNDANYLGYLDELEIILSDPCHTDDAPQYNDQERYALTIKKSQSTLQAKTVWGILRGMETFSQLLYLTDGMLRINETSIYDFPRYPHRGLLLDTSRHFIPMANILNAIDALAYNKMNVFHWHMTDDQSFPYGSVKFPQLSAKGAYDSQLVYSQNEVKVVIEYARVRGVRVIVEFDTPGHTRSWGVAYPSLLTKCYSNNRFHGYGPMDPSKNTTYSFLRQFYKEISQLFTDGYLHIGGDEVDFSCWSSNPEILEFMKMNNIRTFKQLENYFVNNVLHIVNNGLDRSAIVWEDVFDNHVQLSKSTIVHVWRVNWKETINNVTEAGYRALLSTCWYLDHSGAGTGWESFYECEPSSFGGNSEQQHLVKGGEACMWDEMINEFNVESTIWPRASAVAEKLWSADNANSEGCAARRLEEHTCRMNNRGIAAQPPNGPGFCA